MLEVLTPQPNQAALDRYVPPFLDPLAAAAVSGGDTVAVVKTITKSLGFDNFLYGATLSVIPHHEAKAYVFTTHPREWVKRYDEMAFVEVDPRIAKTWDSAIPLVWDQQTFRGQSAACDAYLDEALQYSIGSGVAFLMHLPRECHVFISLTSPALSIDEISKRSISRNLPDIMMFGHYFHEVFMRSVIERGLPPPMVGAPLSKRERECLTLAANGLTTDDIATKLRISARTVQFHFDTIRSKLGAANRQEAIALAVTNGIIQPRTLPMK